jgi:hypothetical protein
MTGGDEDEDGYRAVVGGVGQAVAKIGASTSAVVSLVRCGSVGNSGYGRSWW